MATVRIEISPSGEISIEDEHGEAATFTTELEKALGQVNSRRQECAPKVRDTEQRIQQRT